MHAATRTSSLAPRSTEPADAPHSNSSVFTFLIALLILLCTSAAVVLRAALMRHRFRRRMRAALEAGALLPARPLAEDKPELWEVWVRGTHNVWDWSVLMPVCATKVPADAAFEQKAPRPTIPYRPPPAGRLMEMLGHPPPLSSVAMQPVKPIKEPSECSAVQVVVLISMPSQQPSIPQDLATPPASLKGKERDPDAHDDVDADADTDVFPDVMFGISTFTSSPDANETCT